MSDNYTNVLLEEMNGKFDAVLEIVVDMRNKMQLDMVTKDEFNEVKTDIQIIKAAITDTNHQVQNHERRITKLETA